MQTNLWSSSSIFWIVVNGPLSQASRILDTCSDRIIKSFEGQKGYNSRSWSARLYLSSDGGVDGRRRHSWNTGSRSETGIIFSHLLQIDVAMANPEYWFSS